MKLPLLGSDDETANREYTRRFVLDRDAEIGAKFGLAYGEAYHYIGPAPAKVDEYIRCEALKVRLLRKHATAKSVKRQGNEL